MEIYQILFIVAIALVILLVINHYRTVNKIRKKVREIISTMEFIGDNSQVEKIKISSLGFLSDFARSFNKMSARIHQQTKELKEREQHLEHFYKATYDGIILHEHGKPVLINQAICNMTGYSEKEIMKMPLSKIVLQKNVQTTFKIPLKPITYETETIKKDGKKIFVEVQESAIEYEGKLIRALVLRNITKRIEVEKQLQDERLMRLSWVIDGQEIERSRLARELHDGLGQSLIALKLKFESIEAENEKNRRLHEDLNKLFNKTIEDIRRISHDLMPSGLTQFGITTALRNLCNEITESTGKIVEFDADPKLEDLKLSQKFSLALYRIAQEAINNSIKHSDALQIAVNLLKMENHVLLSIADNGKGFKYESTYKFVGNGIYNMRERVNMLGGTFEVNSELNQGTEVVVRFPINAQ